MKQLIIAGDPSQLHDLLQRDPAKALKPIRWGMPPCKSEPLHFLSDGFFSQLWNHGNEGALASVLIEAGAPVDGLPSSGESPLHGAASLGCLDVAKALIAQGANLESMAKYPGIPDGTPLDFAVHFGMTEIVDLLVASGAAVHSARMAAGAGLLDLLQHKLQTEDTAYIRDDVFRCACICNRIDIADYLMTVGLDVNREIEGGTALHWAAWEAKPEMVAHLLMKGADPNRTDPRYALTPLGWARHRLKEVGPQWGHEKVIDTLEKWEKR